MYFLLQKYYEVVWIIDIIFLFVIENLYTLILYQLSMLREVVAWKSFHYSLFLVVGLLYQLKYCYIIKINKVLALSRMKLFIVVVTEASEIFT